MGGGGKDDKSLVFLFLHSKTLPGFICLGHHNLPSLFVGPILWPLLITWLMSNYLPVSLLRHLGTWSQSKRGNDHSGFFRLYRVSWGSGFPLPALCQGAFTEGDESSWNNKVTCFSIIWVLVREYSCPTTTWRFVVFNKKQI